ncbi:MAG: glycosyltransferase family 39 protein [Blastocatellia bacterium]
MIAGATSVILFFLIYSMRLDKVVGMFQDDAWYALLGKALATGQGYTLINSPAPGILPLYPPAFPFLLSLVFRISPQFPENLWLLKSVSIVAMLLASVACYHYFARYRNLPKHLALAIAAGVALNPGLAFLATSSVMSECVFALAQMVTLISVERCALARDGKRFWVYALLAAAASSWAFLTRSMAVALILAALIYLLKERLIKSAVVFAIGVAALAGSWTFYSRANAPTPEQRAEVNSYIVRAYTEQFWDRMAGHESAGSILLTDMPGRFWDNISSIATKDSGGIVLPILFPALNQGLAERGGAAQLLLSLFVIGLAIAGFVTVVREKLTYAELAMPLSLLIIIAWPFPPYRFLLPSLPMLLFYFLMGSKLVLNPRQRMAQTKGSGNPWPVLTGIATLLFVLSLFANFNYLGRKYGDVASQRPRWMRVFDENEAIMKWTDANVSKSDVIVTPNPALVHLHTGVKTTSFDNPAGNWDRWNRMGVRYLLHISPVRVPGPDPIESRYRILYRGGGDLNLRIVDFGPTEARPPWGAKIPGATEIN